MKAISIKQPWAWLIFHGKTVENRTWPSNHRGPLLIHASQTFDLDAGKWLREFMPGVYRAMPSTPLIWGAIIGRVTMVDCVKNHPSPFFFGPYGHVYENPEMFDKPIPYKGKLGLFNVPDYLIQGEL